MVRRALALVAMALAAGGALGGLGSVALGSTALAAPASPISLAIVLPKSGAVTESTTSLHVLAGGELSTTIRFTVTLDGSPVGADGRLLPSGQAAVFSVPGGAEKDVDLRDLPAGVHRLVVHAVSPPGIPDASVDFTVGPGASRPDGGISVPFVIGLLLIGGLLYFTRRRMADFARSLDPEADDAEEPPGGADGWGDDEIGRSATDEGPELNGHRGSPFD